MFSYSLTIGGHVYILCFGTVGERNRFCIALATTARGTLPSRHIRSVHETTRPTHWS